MGVKLDGNIHESFMAYLRHLISTKQLDADIPADIKPIVVAYFFNMEVFRGGIQCFFEGYSFRLEEVLSAFRLLGVDPELISVVEEAGMHEYLSDDDIYELEPDDEDKFAELIEERDQLWDGINEVYRTANNDVDEKIEDYIKSNNIDFDVRGT